MASLMRTSSLAAACLTLRFVLALCEASQLILTSLHAQSANAGNEVAHDAVPATNAIKVISSQAALQTASQDGSTKTKLAARFTPRGLLSRDCHTSDINIEQFEVSGVGLPTFQVQISNSCTNPLCSISFLIVHCGLFHSGDVLVNPKVFRRLDQLRGTCIVNDGQQIRNADTIIFQYREIWMQPITFQSARVFCHG